MMNNGFVKIEYLDAYYSYSANLLPPKAIKSFAKLQSETATYIDYELKLSNTNEKGIIGLVIPRGVIKGVDFVKTLIKKDDYALNDIVAVYWEDIFAYDSRYDGPHKPTAMLTEGSLIKETKTYVIIDNPETLNLTNSANHPNIKPRRYFIPKAMIQEIRKV
jgi:hypothetical protein